MKLLARQAPPQTEEERQARELLNQGVHNFKNGQYDEAIAAFQRAKQLDATLMNARLYLATAYAAQYIPGADSEENQQLGRKAVEEFRGVLDIDPENLSGIDGIGSILFQMAGQPYDTSKFEESKSCHQKHIELRPNDPEPYYWVGVIDWTLSFRANHDLRARYNEHAGGRKQLQDTDPLPTELRQGYLHQFGPTIDEGVDSLKHAIELRPEYDDAMAYFESTVQAQSGHRRLPRRAGETSKLADDLVDKVKDMKQRRAEQRSQP